MRFLFIGDIVGSPGLACVRRLAPRLRAEHGLDLVIANAENAVGGSGLTPAVYRKLRQAGVDAVTLGDHIYRKLDIVAALEQDDRLCKPANYPSTAPGKDVIFVDLPNGKRTAIFSLMGRTFMRPVDCPFQAAERILDKLGGKSDYIIVDMHAEATADKYLMVHFLKGRVTAVLGTHTHVPTADEQIMGGHTAFISDVGMTGPYESILGRQVDCVMKATLNFVPVPFEVASDDVRLAGVIVTVDDETGKAKSIQRIMLCDRNAAVEGP